MKSKHFEGKIFTNCFGFMKFAKIFPLENNPLYGRSNGIEFHNWGEAAKKNVMYIHNCRLAIFYRTGQARLIIIVDI